MTNVYTTTFYVIHDLVGDGAPVGPPADANYVWVIASIDVVIGNEISSVQVIGSAGQAFFSFGTLEPIGYVYGHYDGRYVLYPGETMYATATVAADVTIAGYQLTLP